MVSEKENILGKNLRELRLARGMKQDDVANALGIPAPIYSSWERGRTEPSIDGLLSLARYYDVSVDRLIVSKSCVLRIGIWTPPIGKFHPIKNLNGIYTLMYDLVFNRLLYSDLEAREEERAVELRLFRWLDLEFLPNPYIIPRSHVDDNECFDGTGPFKLIEEEQQNRLRDGMEQPVRLEASNSYYGKMPSIEAIEFSTYTDLGELRDSLEGGRIDMAYDLEMDESERFHVEYCHGYLSFYLVLDQDADICKDENVRKAVDFAIDRDRLVEKIGTKRAKLMSEYSR